MLTISKSGLRAVRDFLACGAEMNAVFHYRTPFGHRLPVRIDPKASWHKKPELVTVSARMSAYRLNIIGTRRMLTHRGEPRVQRHRVTFELDRLVAAINIDEEGRHFSHLVRDPSFDFTHIVS